VVQPFRGSRR
jgi:hypothetical protein